MAGKSAQGQADPVETVGRAGDPAPELDAGDKGGPLRPMVAELPDGMVAATFVVVSLQRGEGSRPVAPVDDDDPPARPDMERYETVSVTLEPARRAGDVEGFNARLWAILPRGQLVLGKMDAAAAAGFKIGGLYHLALQPVERQGDAA